MLRISTSSRFKRDVKTCDKRHWDMKPFKATIAAEVIGVPRNAMGTQLYHAKIYLQTDALMAWTVAVILLSMVTEKLLRKGLERGRRRVHHP